MREHVYRHYPSIDVCQNCAKFRKEIEAQEHWVFETGYCDPRFCPRCKAENCAPMAPSAQSA